MKIKKCYLSAVLLLLLVSCGTQMSQSLSDELSCPTVLFKNLYGVQKQDPLRLNIPDSIIADFDKWSFLNDSLLVTAFTFQSKDALTLFDIKEQKFLSKVIVPQYLLSDQISGLCFLNADSILFLHSYPIQMRLITCEGVYLQSLEDEVDLSQFQTAATIEQEVFEIFPGTAYYTNPIYDSNRHELYVNIHPSGAEIMAGFENVPRIGVFNLDENRWSRFIAAPQGVMKLKDGLCYDYEFSIPYFNLVDDKLYVSWPMDHYIYVYNSQTAEYIEKKAACSSKGEALTEPKSASKMENHDETRKFRLETNFYSPLYYHKDLELFSRIYYFKTESRKIKGQRVADQRKSAVIFLDKSLKIVGEQFFDEEEFPVTGTFQSSDGFLRNVPYEEQEDNFLIFDKYLIKAL